MTFRPALLLAALCACAHQAAQALDLPAGARLAAERSEPLGIVDLPTGPWHGGAAETIAAEGVVTLQAWQIAPTALSTLQILAPLRDQLADEGFEVVFQCDAGNCGGFEFRYAMSMLPEPAMHVDLGDFRYLLMHRTDGADGAAGEYLALVVSRATNRGFLHLASVGPADSALAGAAPQDGSRARIRPRPRGTPATPDTAAPDTAAPEPTASDIAAPEPTASDIAAPTVLLPAIPAAPPLPATLAADLDGVGHAVLSDLSFESGSSRLADADFASLDALAAWMEDHPQAHVVLVGHTDARGALNANIELSRKRAAAVLERLRDRHGIAAVRMEAEGVGYLAPLATNATEAGRTANRRVEVVVAGGG